MYSMVLMMAMSTSPETAACHKSYGCTGCTGCSGAVADCGCCGGGGGFFGGLFRKHKHGCNGCNGCNGCSGCTGDAPAGCNGCSGAPAPAPAPAPEPAPAPPKDMPKDKKGGVTKNFTAPALITVSLPADAVLTIDGVATKSSNNVRIFQTPTLKVGTVQYYTFSAEVVRNGVAYTATEQVAVEAGAKAVISLNPNVGPAVASK